MNRVRSLVRSLAVLTTVSLSAAGCGDGTDTPAGGSASGGEELVGLFSLTAGACEPAPTGSYFRMVQPAGTAEAGPFVTNGDSSCADKTVTPLSPGTDGGLRTGGYQPQPEPAFDPGGNALSTAIAQPQPWFAVAFGLATNPSDPQMSSEASAPTISVDGTALSGDLRALAAAWNGQHFNQGSPKPDGSRPGLTEGPTGTYNADTGAYTLDWSSQIVGGPFNNFTGLWHLEGTFTTAG